MRFKSKKIDKEIIVREWFAFFPIQIDRETRWLEFVKVRGYYWFSYDTCSWYWQNLEFVD